jgi:hypothetical protein
MRAMAMRMAGSPSLRYRHSVVVSREIALSGDCVRNASRLTGHACGEATSQNAASATNPIATAQPVWLSQKSGMASAIPTMTMLARAMRDQVAK